MKRGSDKDKNAPEDNIFPFPVSGAVNLEATTEKEPDKSNTKTRQHKVKKPSYSGPRHPLTAEAEEKRLPHRADRMFHALAAKMTGGVSPASLYLAYADWWLHAAAYPQRRMKLAADAQRKAVELGYYMMARSFGWPCEDCAEPEERDDRFRGEGWQALPFSFYAQSFLQAQDWWEKATQELHGVSEHHEDVVRFTARQWLDMIAPVNFPALNPEVLRVTIDKRGMNFLSGAANFAEDTRRRLAGELPRGTEDFQVGENLAVTEGKVVYRNHLIELIQYEPKTDKVHPEPVLIIPAWIMKYYILDLSPQNSMVRYLVEKGYTVFMISWHNPDEKDRNLTFADYLDSGIMDALDAVNAIVPDQSVHATGYCIGGTLLAIAAALMGQRGDDRLASLTLFTTQLDYEEAGELLLFIDESQLAYLEDLMWMQGYLDKTQVSGAFNMLRSKDLIWSHMVEQYQKGNDNDMFDLLAWNMDSTRIPYKAHAEYLRSLYLNNDLAEHRYRIGSEIVYLRDIKVPVFAVATMKDHIAPWKSVYQMHRLLDTDLTFVLTSGGHNAGVISEPGRKNRHYKIRHHTADMRQYSAEEWRGHAVDKKGSWWPVWQKWLHSHSGAKVQPPSVGAPDEGYEPLCDAPGTYVFER